MPLGFPIVDPHIHLWDPGNTPREVTPAVKLFGWNDRLLRTLGPRLFPKSALDFVGVIDHVMAPYLPGTYRRDTGGWDVRGYVYVQAGWNKSEKSSKTRPVRCYQVWSLKTIPNSSKAPSTPTMNSMI